MAPIIARPDEPERFQVRSSYFTMAPHQVPFDTMSAWYRAFDRHARFDGARWVRGIYLDP